LNSSDKGNNNSKLGKDSGNDKAAFTGCYLLLGALLLGMII